MTSSFDCFHSVCFHLVAFIVVLSYSSRDFSGCTRTQSQPIAVFRNENMNRWTVCTRWSSNHCCKCKSSGEHINYYWVLFWFWRFQMCGLITSRWSRRRWKEIRAMSARFTGERWKLWMILTQQTLSVNTRCCNLATCSSEQAILFARPVAGMATEIAGVER